MWLGYHTICAVKNIESARVITLNVGDIYSGFSINSEANASEFIENLEEMLPLYW